MNPILRFDEYENFAEAMSNFWESHDRHCLSAPLYEIWETEVPILNDLLHPWKAKFHFFLGVNDKYDCDGLFEFESEAELLAFILTWR